MYDGGLIIVDFIRWWYNKGVKTFYPLFACSEEVGDYIDVGLLDGMASQLAQYISFVIKNSFVDFILIPSL